MRGWSGADRVIIPIGVPRTAGITRDDRLNMNAGSVKFLCPAGSKHCPEPVVNMINNLVNSSIPIATEVFKQARNYMKFLCDYMDTMNHMLFEKSGLQVWGII
ncbi:hypothetical protein KP509_27G054000 [Ceratopteris richardii]|uniref:malate dehydrogenase n=1 Tax=Ceratopteris richardii TaxID=49495 RepID=A0A8T2RHV9_CERRI|nr:hypothetical protein KP509_27G054000 [Ceratopteris richardii]